MFVYCGNNPVVRSDPDGDAWETIWDLISLGLSIAGVINNPDDFWAWAGLVGDLVDVAIPFVGGLGEATRAVNVASDVVDAADDLYDAGRVADSVDDFSDTYKVATEGACFISGTLILAESGYVSIETIATNDLVWAWDEESGDIALKRVVETYINQTAELIHVSVNGDEIITTPSHPFYSPVKGWTEAANLRAGDILVLVNGEYVVVEKVQHEILEAPIAVYNFQVEEYHTYFVTNAGVLVHNSCVQTEGSLLPDSYWANKTAPEYNTPNSTYTNYRYNQYTGELEYSIAYYDIGGRQSMRIDWTNHGRLDHGNPHIHYKLFNAQYPMGIKVRLD